MIVKTDVSKDIFNALIRSKRWEFIPGKTLPSLRHIFNTTKEFYDKRRFL